MLQLLTFPHPSQATRKAEQLAASADKLAATAPAAAFALYTQAASLGLMFPLGKFHAEAAAPYANPGMALKYLKKATNTDPAWQRKEAHLYLGRLYLEGTCVKRNLDTAERHFGYIEANFSSEEARFLLARTYEARGLGFHPLAIREYADILARNRNHTEACERLKALAVIL